MLDRCSNPKNSRWKDYGGRGIAVCARWQHFENFVKDMGKRPDGLTLDRIDNDLGYFKANCRWTTLTEQSRNRRFCVLTKEKANQIRLEPRKCKNGRGPGQTKAEIAKKYQVSLATVKKVLSNSYWI